MSLLDSNIDINLSPELLKSIWNIPINTKVISFDPYKFVSYSSGYHHLSYIEVWYPDSIYKGSLWVYAHTKLTTNMVHVSFLRNPNNTNWMAREDMVFSGLTFDEFGELMNALKEKNWEYLDNLHIYKPFKPEYEQYI